MAKLDKRTKKFIKNKLDRTLKDRRSHAKKKAVIDRAQTNKKFRAQKRSKEERHAGAEGDVALDGGDLAEEGEDEDMEAEDNDDSDDQGGERGNKTKAMTVEDFLGGGFKEGMDDDHDEQSEADGGEDDLASIDELSDDETSGRVQDLQKLAEKDPEFYKYLQENDKELLNFGKGGDGDEDTDEAEDEELVEQAEDEEEDDGPEVVTDKLLKSWQSSLLKHRSLRAFRRLLLAFRSAARMGDAEAEQDVAYVINSAPVFNKVLLTTLKYTPVILKHHVPYKTLSKGKFKLPTESRKWAGLQKSVQSYFVNLHHLLRTLPEPDMVYVAVSESEKMIPFLINSRKLAREYVKIMLDLWSTARDNVRIAAFLCVRTVALASDETMMDVCLKGTYHSFVRSTKLTTVHTLPSINLMKNSASEMYALDTSASYQHAFGFIRQLAIHLRNCLRTKSKDTFRNVLNWQFVHCIDFWSIVLGAACDQDKKLAKGEESPLQPLIYPLVQVAVGVINLIPTSRYFPLRMHLLRSLLRLMQRTGVYVPLFPSLLEMFSAPEFQRKSKGSTLAPLDLTTTLRAPIAYVRTRVFADQLADEASYLLLELLATQARSIAFPELVLPPSIQMRRAIKTSTSASLARALRPVLDKAEANAKWIEERRSRVDYAPSDVADVRTFLRDEKKEAPIESALRLAKKVREQKRRMLDQQKQRVDS